MQSARKRRLGKTKARRWCGIIITITIIAGGITTTTTIIIIAGGITTTIITIITSSISVDNGAFEN